MGGDIGAREVDQREAVAETALLPEQIAIIEKHLGQVPPSDPPTIHDAIAKLSKPTRKSVRLKRPHKFFDTGLRLRVGVTVSKGPFYVFGYYVVDRAAVRDDSAGKILQDIVVLDITDQSAIYYSGGRAETASAGHIARDFCEVFGSVVPEAFGCRRTEAGWDMGDHRYADENDPRLPGEAVNRELFAFAMQRVRRDEGVT